ncbi:hypothetical protein AB0J86_38255 [Micromonospora sp. NPDC049559]|uniref:hypothetical protein n=1 Tax=Micromonospora sp. NPDC049559 TaxID=3155923 RepID=UPI00341AAD5A
MTSPPARAVRPVVVLLFGNIAVNLIFAALTLVFRHEVLAYQLARDPGADEDSLAATLWTRPIPILIMAVAYVWVARQLWRGQRRAYLRVRVVSAAGLLAVGWLVLSAAYPTWLRVLQVAQLVLLAALVLAVNRRVLRTAFAAGPKPAKRPGHRGAALLLMLLTPVIAEVALGTVALRTAWVIPIYLPIYGAGALFVREVVRRTGGGWPSLLLMGVVYGLVEEGLALQSLTSPNIYHAADWAPRMLGVNTAYAEVNLAYHAVFSIAIPITLLELVFRRHGRAPYLRRGGLVSCGFVALLGVALLRVSVPPDIDPGYLLPGTAAVAIVGLIVVLSVLALRVLPRRAAGAPAGPAPVAVRAEAGPVLAGARPGGAPRPITVGLCCAVATFGFFALIWPFGGAHHPAYTHGNWSFVPMAGAAVLAALTALALRRWGSAADWTDRHRLAAITGALLAHTAFGFMINARTTPDRAFLAGVAVLTVVLTGLLDRRLARSGSTVVE